jgi:hypothetical protein
VEDDGWRGGVGESITLGGEPLKPSRLIREELVERWTGESFKDEQSRGPGPSEEFSGGLLGRQCASEEYGRMRRSKFLLLTLFLSAIID